MDHHITKEKLQQLEEELKESKTTKMALIAKRLKKAKDFGDLSENAEYHEAKEAKQMLEKRVYELEDIIRNAIIIKMHNTGDTVSFGTTFVVIKDKSDHQFTLVGQDEVNMEKGYISNESPIGKAFLGAKKGDVITVETPGGKSKYKIKSIN
ncbi:MAG: transcription elongation factor GreA [Candidatus Harrisonbacteria bacterium CG10_big_fil_rev_8_21_14_0_10_38_8]|uniref:Transcription elongation factor GreA n=1 Tax=Candidatus Harrisonbacteria bacterium CG10_big_fil_rev_8_21_14_0_10_38_8 TaxID=1974582 RepID=A0A2M6WKN0_9BACT|nr:MAG: transcription elongation factor GreA [Candidatus Harrisonbacteria bacterium CG10_big_fil_rev_8_21_14_0_10_38_8]